MSWRIEEAVRARYYSSSDERAAYRRGYVKGFYSDVDIPNPQGENLAWPNAYAAGFWDGRADR